MLLIEAYCPRGCLPRSDQNRFRCISDQFAKQECADAFASLPGPYVRMTNQGDVRLVLNSHYCDDFIVIDVTREHYALLDLRIQLFAGHVWLMPTVCWNHSLIS